jgi:hypothetical protein
MKLSTTINLSEDPKMLVVQLTEYLRQISQQVNGLTDGSVYPVHSARIAAPTTGTFAQGDFIRNATPSGATPVFGWICTASGTPGTWVALTAN